MSNELIDLIKEEAKKLYPDNEKQAELFVNGFITKAAGLMDYFTLESPNKETYKGPNFGGSIAKGLGESLGRTAAGMAGAGAIAGMAGLAKTYSGHKLYNDFLKALQEAIQMNRILQVADPQKVMNFANTIFKFAPHVATDSNLLSSILANAIHGEGIDTMTIRTLTELEGRYSESKSHDVRKWVV